MALQKFPKPKTFHVDYCGCTAAALLLNEPAVRDAINFVRQSKSKRDFVRTRLTISKDGVRIVYDDEQSFSTQVPATMIAGSTRGKASFHDTIGVVYISPLTGRHYPAFVHVYRCDSSRTAQKLLVRFRAYTSLDDHRAHVVQLEQNLLDHNLLTLEPRQPAKVPPQSPNTTTLESTRTNTAVSSSSASSGSRPEKNDAVRSITEELQKKIDSHEPLLFPPKDYDTIRAGHGHIQRAHAWKSTDPTVVGYTSIDPDKHRAQKRQTLVEPSSSSSKKSSSHGIESSDSSNHAFENGARPRFSSQRSDTTIDPVEAVSLAFEFLKDETDSILTDTDGNIEPLESEEQNRSSVFRFRPPPITAFTKKLFPRTHNYDLQNDLNGRSHDQHTSNGHRARSETNLHHESQADMRFSPRYESRVVHRNGAPVHTNPLWSSASPAMVGSQPNLLVNHSPPLQAPVHRLFSPPVQRRMTSIPLQHPLYAVHSSDRLSGSTYALDKAQKRSEPASTPAANVNKRQVPSTKYFDTNEFILRASNEALLNNSQYPSRLAADHSRSYRAQTIDVDSNSNAMLDVYY